MESGGHAQVLFDAGVRDFQPIWDTKNALWSPLEMPGACNTDAAELSPVGVAVLHEAIDLGMLIDLSHMPVSAFAAAINEVVVAAGPRARPIFVSHTTVSDVTIREYIDNHNRLPRLSLPVVTTKAIPCGATESPDCVSTAGHQLNKAAIARVAAMGGVISVHFVSGYHVRPQHGTQTATITDIVDHIDAIRQLVGIQYVALGPDYFPQQQGFRWVAGGEFGRGPALLQGLVAELISRGFSDHEIRGVLGENLRAAYISALEKRPRN